MCQFLVNRYTCWHVVWRATKRSWWSVDFVAVSHTSFPFLSCLYMGLNNDNSSLCAKYTHAFVSTSHWVFSNSVTLSASVFETRKLWLKARRHFRHFAAQAFVLKRTMNQIKWHLILPKCHKLREYTVRYQQHRSNISQQTLIRVKLNRCVTWCQRIANLSVLNMALKTQNTSKWCTENPVRLRGVGDDLDGWRLRQPTGNAMQKELFAGDLKQNFFGLAKLWYTGQWVGRWGGVHS